VTQFQAFHTAVYQHQVPLRRRLRLTTSQALTSTRQIFVLSGQIYNSAAFRRRRDEDVAHSLRNTQVAIRTREVMQSLSNMLERIDLIDGSLHNTLPLALMARLSINVLCENVRRVATGLLLAESRGSAAAAAANFLRTEAMTAFTSTIQVTAPGMQHIIRFETSVPPRTDPSSSEVTYYDGTTQS